MSVSADSTYAINPLKKIRQTLRLSQSQLAKSAGITAQSVLKYEQGLYQEPSKSILNALLQFGYEQDTVINLQTLIRDYHEWRLVHQAAQRWLFAPVRSLSISADQHPLASLRAAVGEGYTQQGFAVLLALHPATLFAYERGEAKHMPGVIRDALENAGCRKNIIQEVNNFGALYYDSLHAKN